MKNVTYGIIRFKSPKIITLAKVTGKPPINYLIMYVMFVFSLSVMSNPLRLHGLQDARLSCPSPTPGASSTEWVIPSNHLILCRPLLLLPSVLPSFIVFSNELALMSLASDSQSIGASASASVLSMNIQDWFRDWLVWSHTDLMYVIISAITTIMWLPKHEGGRKEWENKSIQNML